MAIIKPLQQFKHLLEFATMANFYSYRNTQQALARLNKLDELPKITPTSYIGSILYQAASLILAPVLYTKEHS